MFLIKCYNCCKCYNFISFSIEIEEGFQVKMVGRGGGKNVSLRKNVPIRVQNNRESIRKSLRYLQSRAGNKYFP